MEGNQVNLFGVGSCLNEDQVAKLEDINVSAQPISPNSCKVINSCGLSIQELLDTYSFYNSQKGIYKSWGDIEFPWQIENLTPNLLFNSTTDDKWKVATYHSIYAYFTDDLVLLVEDDGFRLALYRAKENISTIAGPFNRSKWERVCYIETTVPVGLLSIKELKEKYSPYDLDLYLTEWGEFNSNWSEPHYNTVVENCTAISSNIEELEKCIKTNSEKNSDDRWEYAKLRKDYFYRVGDYIIVEGECADNVCLYICIKDIPATEEIYNSNRLFSININGVAHWEKIYCVATGKNKCLEPRRSRDLPNYQFVQLGPEGHYVEQPIPYYKLSGNKLCKEFETLNDFAEQIPPKVLTQEEIDALDGG